MNDDELAAVVMALQQLAPPSHPHEPAGTGVWKLAMLEPDFGIDDLRAAARGSRNVP